MGPTPSGPPWGWIAAGAAVQAGDADRATDAGDERVEQFMEALTSNPDTTPEPGATCESPAFLDSPRPAAP